MFDFILKGKNFNEWRQNVLNNGNIINGIDLKGVIIRNDNEIKKALIDCNIKTPEGNNIKRCILMGKKSVVIVPMLICNSDNKIYTLMVEQRRIVHGGMTIEFPAGEIAENEDPISAAAKEIIEETNVIIPPDELIQLNSDPIWVSPSYTYNPVYYFYFKKNIDEQFISDNNLAKTGVNDDGEYITVKVILMKDVQNIFTSSAIIGIKLLEKHLNTVFN